MLTPEQNTYHDRVVVVDDLKEGTTASAQETARDGFSLQAFD